MASISVLSLNAQATTGAGSSLSNAYATRYSVIISSTGTTGTANVILEAQRKDGSWINYSNFIENWNSSFGINSKRIQQFYGPFLGLRLNIDSHSGDIAVTGEILAF